jgi:hypothetical protein
MDSDSYRLEFSGPLPVSLVEEIKRRFGPVQVATDLENNLALFAALDQSGLRSLLDLIWEVGAEVRSVCMATGSGAVGNQEGIES